MAIWIGEVVQLGCSCLSLGWAVVQLGLGTSQPWFASGWAIVQLGSLLLSIVQLGHGWSGLWWVLFGWVWVRLGGVALLGWGCVQLGTLSLFLGTVQLGPGLRGWVCLIVMMLIWASIDYC